MAMADRKRRSQIASPNSAAERIVSIPPHSMGALPCLPRHAVGPHHLVSRHRPMLLEQDHWQAPQKTFDAGMKFPRAHVYRRA